MINVEVKKEGRDDSLGVLKKFSKRIKDSGIIPKVKSLRYNDRSFSPFVKKKKALKKIQKSQERERLHKLGKKQ